MHKNMWCLHECLQVPYLDIENIGFWMGFDEIVGSPTNGVA